MEYLIYPTTFLLEIDALREYWPAVLLIVLASHSLPEIITSRAVYLFGLISAAATAIAMLDGVQMLPWPFTILRATYLCGLILVAAAFMLPLRRTTPSRGSIGGLLARLALIGVAVLAMRLSDPSSFVKGVMTEGKVGAWLVILSVGFLYTCISAILLRALRPLFATGVLILMIATLGMKGAALVLNDNWGPLHLEALSARTGVGSDLLGICIISAVGLIIAFGRWLMLRLELDSPVELPEGGSHLSGTVVRRIASHANGEVLHLPMVRWQRMARDALIFWTGFSLLFPEYLMPAELAKWVMAFALGAWGLSLAAYIVSLSLAQRQRNAALQSLYNAEAGVPGRYFLYLRSFDIGHSSLLGRIAYHVVTTTLLVYLIGRRYDFEEELADALQKHGLLVAIGNRLESAGAAKLVTGDEWKADFAVLSEAAMAIFFAPGSSDNVLWEMERVLEGPALKAKTIWVMPSKVRQTDWQATANRVQEKLGVTLPEHRMTGMFFTLDAQRRPHNKMDLEEFIGEITAKGGVARSNVSLASHRDTAAHPASC